MSEFLQLEGRSTLILFSKRDNRKTTAICHCASAGQNLQPLRKHAYSNI